MLNKRISKKAFIKIISGLLIFVTILTGFGYQNHKIKDLEEELYFKHKIEERAGDSITTKYDKESIETKFNSIQEYKIFSSRISVKHKYDMTEEAILGFDKKATLTGNANVYFQYNVSLADANISETDDKITIELKSIYLDRDTVNIVPNSFIRLDDECSKNLLANYKSGEKIMDYWNQSLIEKSYEYIEENYNDSIKIRAYATREIKDLVNTITDKKVEVIFKE
jgi:hypothetical protein